MSSLQAAVISDDELAQIKSDYVRDGFCYVRGAVPQAAVDALVDDLWRQAAVKTSTQWNGLKKNEPSTYPRQWPLLSVSLFPDPSELWKPLCESPKLGAALDALLGAGKWECPQEKYHLYFPLKLPEPLPDNDDDNDKSSAATTALPHPPEVAAAPERANPEQLRECSGRKPHVATCDSRGRAHYGWHVDLGKHFGDRGLGGSRTLASNDYSAAVVLFVLSDTGFGEGGTTFLRGGPRVVAAALGERGEMTHAELLKYCNDYLNTKVSDGGIKLPLFEPEANDVIGDGRIHSYTGLRGDAFIFHPWAMHSPARNYTDAQRVRFMGNATVHYKAGAFRPWFTPETANDCNDLAAAPFAAHVADARAMAIRQRESEAAAAAAEAKANANAKANLTENSNSGTSVSSNEKPGPENMMKPWHRKKISVA